VDPLPNDTSPLRRSLPTGARQRKPDAGNWKMETGSVIFQFLVSNFQFLVSLNTPQIVDSTWPFPRSWTPLVWRPRLHFVENAARFVENILC
jgi:hypothetical protein